VLFHLGALWRLNELGYLPKLDRVSSVSGGSIAAAVLALSWSELEFQSGGVAGNFQDLVVEPLRRFARKTIDLPAVLLHSDFHPGNVLWRYGRVSGVVDWPGACSGPAAADVGHCRINLLTMGAEVASRFTVRWEQLAGTTYHPWGDVVTVVGFLDDLRDDWGSERLLVEDMLARAIAELAG